MTVITHSEKWQVRFIQMARVVSSWSKDPSTQVGSVIVRPDKTICSIGYNGFPRGVKDDPELFLDRAEKQSRMIHSELNAIFNSRDPSLDGYSLFNYSVPPCDRCAAHVIQAGIKRVYFGGPDPSDYFARYAAGLARSAHMYKQAGVFCLRVEIPEEP